MAAEDLEWERSKISNQDMNLLKRLGFTKKKDALRFPREESYPKPPMEYRARKNPLWMYAGDEDVERLSTDLSAKDLEKLIRRISKLSKKDTIPTSCKVAPFCRANPLPEGHLVLSSLPPLPEGGEVEERAVVTDDNQGISRPESGAGDSHKSAASLEKETEAEVSSSTRSSLPAASPKGKRKRDEAIDSGTSKVNTSRAGKSALDAEEETLDLYGAALPFMKELVRFGTQFIGYRDYARELEEKLAEANKRADALAIELEHSESTHTKTVEDLEKRLGDAKRALEENVAQHSAREEEILSRLETQSRRFVRRTHQEYELENPEDDELLDALSLLEIHGTEARNGLDEAEAGLSRLFPYFFHKKEQPATFIDLAQCFNGKEDLGLQLRQEGLKVGVEGTMALIAESQQQIDWSKVGDTGKIETKKWQSLIKAAKPNSKKILATLGYKPAPAPSSSKPEVK
ncbi:hypothetical protein QYE76_026998 [Lolium multiflorum]|uniref:Uncharacterized protein n=1 Tax=Lolium multiflorum TaxID=4521 RepID=A0AAD8Q1E2_LOLMU|nr:hypothetical protein QYE76_026998 [Lolium multiflorum]